MSKWSDFAHLVADFFQLTGTEVQGIIVISQTSALALVAVLGVMGALAKCPRGYCIVSSLFSEIFTINRHL